METNNLRIKKQSVRIGNVKIEKRIKTWEYLEKRSKLHDRIIKNKLVLATIACTVSKNDE